MLGSGERDNEEMMNTLNSVVLNWFDYYLKGNGALNILDYYLKGNGALNIQPQY